MKVSLIAATAFGYGIAAAAASSSPPALGYLFRRANADGESSTMPRQAARLLMQQRLGADTASSLKDLEGVPDMETALESLDRFGRWNKGLFEQDSGNGPAQLVVLVEGVEAKVMENAMADLRPSFEVADPPSEAAHRMLIDEVVLAGVREIKCEIDRAVNALDSDCWGDDRSSVAKFDASKEPSVLASLESIASTLARLAKNGDMETLVLLIPEASRKAKAQSWSSQAQQQPLLRRQAETVMKSMDDDQAQKSASKAPQATSPAAGTAVPSFAARKKKAKIPSCFATRDACMSATGNCTNGQGRCRNKWRRGDDEGEDDDDGDGKARRDDDNGPSGGKKKRAACFACDCLKKSRKSTTQWAGPTCDKMDMSVPVALFVGIAILLAITVAGAIKMLFEVGSAPLPGVLGAGVSKK